MQARLSGRRSTSSHKIAAVPDEDANDERAASIRAAEVVLPCAELQSTLDFFLERLGFRLDLISPADDPRTAVISGHGLRILLRRGSAEPPGTLRLACDDPAAFSASDGGQPELVAPNGTRIELVEAAPVLAIPPGRNELVVTRAGDESAWVTGRAGMRYRDLIPGRLGGRFIASHIQIRDGGPVPDHVHFHAIRFQMIYCAKGWVRVVYEDQGPPLVLAAGDAVLQPPLIRHRVLESSPGLEVIEVACPAEHDTLLDHALELPTTVVRRERDFGGQRFVHHEAGGATWRPSRHAAFECRDLGFAEATGGLADVQVVRPAGALPTSESWKHGGELLFLYVLAGELTLEGTGAPALASGDSIVLPPGLDFRPAARTDDLELLQVRLPGRAP